VAISTIPAVQQAILTILTARTGSGEPLEGVEIRPALLTENEDMTSQAEYVLLTDVDVPEENWGSLGAYQRREEYWVGIAVWTQQWGDDPLTVRVRAHEIWSAVSDALIDDLRTPGGLLTGAGVQQIDGYRGRDSVAPVGPSEWGARIDRSVNFKAKITTTL
jgi:hypothetical protein